jgi:hypothetical protein
MSGFDKNTIALLHFDDSATKDECGNLWTISGSAVVSSTESKFGNKSLLLSNGFISSPISPVKPMTVDFWFYPINYEYLFDWGRYGGDMYVGIYNGGFAYSSLVQSVATPAVNKWQHVALCYSGTKFTFYLDGTKKLDFDYTISDTEWEKQTDSFVIGDSSNRTSAYYDEFRISDIVRYTEDFTPPTRPYSGNSIIYLTGAEAWGMDSNGTFSQLSTNWANESDVNKIALFTATDGQVPTVTDLKTLTMPIKAVRYSEVNTQPNCIVTAVPQPQTVTPKGRISLKKYAKLNGVSITGATSGNGSVKVAMTKDNSTYQVYDTTSLAWVDINIADIGTDGMSLSDISALTSAEWLAYDCMSSGIGFAYYLEMASTSDTAYTDELTLNVELLGELKSLVKGTDYNYSYVSNDVLQVKLYKNGDFRINYNPGES